MQSRYYSPEWGRFINADATGGKVGTLLSHNVFAYCLNNPVNMSDPNGNWPKWAKWAVAAVIVIAVVAVIVLAPEVAVLAAELGGAAELAAQEGMQTAEKAAVAIEDEALVVRGGESTAENLAKNLAKDVRGHISANSSNGISLKNLATTPEAFKNGKLSVTTVARIRDIGMDVISDPTKFNPYHASIIPNGVSLDKLSEVFDRVINIFK